MNKIKVQAIHTTRITNHNAYRIEPKFILKIKNALRDIRPKNVIKKRREIILPRH